VGQVGQLPRNKKPIWTNQVQSCF